MDESHRDILRDRALHDLRIVRQAVV
jgi:hypothetical protein